MERVDLADSRVTLYRADSLALLLDIEGIDHVVTDPPYSSGGAFRGDRMGRTATKYQSTEHRGRYLDFTGDNRDQRSFAHWSALWLSAALQISRPGGLCLVFTDWRQLPSTTDALQAGGWVWRGIVGWDKTEAARPQRGRFRSQLEYVVWGSNGALIDEGPCAPGVFRESVFGADRQHMAGKPVGLMGELLQLAKPGEVILDPFMGAGTTGVAALRRGCRFVGVELDRDLFAIARARIEEAARQPDFFVRSATQVQSSIFDGDI